MNSYWFFVFLFEFILLLFYYLLIRNSGKLSGNRSMPVMENEPMFLSIVIAAKNEAHNLYGLLKTISENNYPSDKYEIIIVDDNSTDETYSVLQKLITSYPNLKILRNTNQPGKRGALTLGIESAKSGNIVVTDADCRPERNWLNGYNDLFVSGSEFIFGRAPYFQRNGITNKIACFENYKSEVLSTVSLKLNLPHSAAARNLGFTRQAFYRCGGYNNTLETMSGDDDLLLREMSNLKIKISYLDEDDTCVFSESKRTLKEYLKQKARHTTTSFHYPLNVKCFLLFWHAPQNIFQFIFLLGFINAGFIIMTILKLLFEIFISIKQTRRNHYDFKLSDKLILPFIYEFFLLINLVSSKTIKPTWK